MSKFEAKKKNEIRLKATRMTKRGILEIFGKGCQKIGMVNHDASFAPEDICRETWNIIKELTEAVTAFKKEHVATDTDK